MLTIESKSTKNSQIKLLVFVGELDNVDSNVISTQIAAEINQGNKFFIADMSALSYISSTGLLDLLYAKEMIRKNRGIIVFYGFQKNVLATLDLLGLFKILQIYPTFEESYKYIHPAITSNKQ